MERKKNPSAFIRNTYNILQRPDLNNIIAWSQDGDGFIIHDLARFENQILPQYFKHQKYSSFVRQLNMYGFHKQRHLQTDNYFQHETFRRGQSLCEIKRKPEKKKKGDEQIIQMQEEVQLKPKQKYQQTLIIQQLQQAQANPQLQLTPISQSRQQASPAHNPHPHIHQTHQCLETRQPQTQYSHQYPTQSQQPHPTSTSLPQLCDSIILQNQILVKMHPMINNCSISLKKKRLQELRMEGDQQQEGDADLGALLAMLRDGVRAEVRRMKAFLDDFVA